MRQPGRSSRASFEPGSLRTEASGISPRFLELLAAERLGGRRVLDVGCGWGRLSLILAPASGGVVGLDRDPGAIAEARRRAAAAGLERVEFHEADADVEEYARWAPDVVTAHLYASDAMIERAARALPARGGLAMVAFHVDQWRETGKVSRFAYDETRMRETLQRAGFTPEIVELEREVKEFASVEEGLAAAVGLQHSWRADGRWVRYLAFL